MRLRFTFPGKTLFIGCISIFAALLVIGAIARADDEPPTPLPLSAIGVDMSASASTQGLIGPYNLELFGPQSCTRYGDPFTALYNDRLMTVPNIWYSELNGAYTYRIAIPSGYETSYDQVRIELFDPQTGNSPSLPTTICQSDGDCTTTIPVCSSPSWQTEPCLLSTTIDGTNADPVNPFYFVRMDEVRRNCTEPLGAPYSAWQQANTRTLFRLYYYRPAAGGGVEPVDLAYYIGKKDDPAQTQLIDPFGGTWQAAQTGTQAQSEALSTMLTWVSPGAPDGERMPAYTAGDIINGVPTQLGSPAEPVTVTEDCNAIRTLQLPFTTPNPFSPVAVSASESCIGNGDFIVSLTDEAPDIIADPVTGVRYLYLDVRGIDGGSENNFAIWAGPSLAENPDAPAPAEVNARQLYILRQQAVGHTMHSTGGLEVYGVGHLPLNLDVSDTHGRFPVADLGPEYAGMTLTVDLFDADWPGNLAPPLIFYMDTISQDDWQACFANLDTECITDQGGQTTSYLGTATLGSDANGIWGNYTFTLPAASFIPGRLMAYYNGGVGDTSGWRITVNPPDAPALDSPADGASVEETPVYRWFAPPGAVAYQFQYAGDVDFTSVVHTSGEITGLSYTPPAQAVGTAFWRVRARNMVYRWGEWSAPRSITISPPGAPTNLTATTISATQIDLSWNDSSSTEDGFKIERGLAGSGVWDLIDTTAADATTYSDLTALCGTAYDYRVIATRAGIDSDPSNVASATTDACQAPGPVLKSPRYGAAVYTRTPKYIWKAVTGATNYRIQVATTPDFSSGMVVNVETLSATPYYRTPPDGPLAMGRYYWKVSAETSSGWTGYSRVSWFDVTLLKTPKNGAAIYTRRPRLTWLKVKDAELPYLIQISSGPECLETGAMERTSWKPSYRLLPGDALHLGTYSWRVSADGGEKWTPCWQFDVTTLKSPKYGAVVSTTKPKFTWLANKEASGYRLSVDRVAEDGTVTLDIIAEETISTKYIPEAPLEYGHYVWRIEEFVNGSYSERTPDARFDITNMRKPANDAYTLDTTPTFVWKKIKSEMSYTLQVSEDPEFGSYESYPAGKASKLTLAPADALERGVYYWRVVTDHFTMPGWVLTIGP